MLVTLGALVISGFNEYKNVIGDLDEYKASPIVLIVVGTVVFFVAFMGCCGVLRESNCMMMTVSVPEKNIVFLELFGYKTYFFHRNEPIGFRSIYQNDRVM